jgi:hypothetical protein
MYVLPVSTPGIFLSFGKKYWQATENPVFVNTRNTG